MKLSDGYAEIGFWLLVVFSVVTPFAIYGVLMVRRAISRRTVMVLGFALIAIAAIDLHLLQKLDESLRHTPALANDGMFSSEVSLALYLLPLTFAGIGVNVVSHVLVAHLIGAERRFRREHRDPRPDTCASEGEEAGAR